jgi:molecular chaperone HscB
MDFNSTHFELFGLPALFRTDMDGLESAYRKLQNEVHPDRFVAAGESEKRLSMQWATRVNEAFQTLKKPLERGVYLLHLQGIEALSEKQTAYPPAFLIQQMEWREAIGDARSARNAGALDKLMRELRTESKNLEQALAVELDDQKNYQAAAGTLRQLKFMHKLVEEIGDAQEELDAA